MALTPFDNVSTPFDGTLTAFDGVELAPPGFQTPEVRAGPWMAAPWNAGFVPVAEGAWLQIAPPPPPPNYSPAPEVTAGPPFPGAPWFHGFVAEGQRFSPGTGILLPGTARPTLTRHRVGRIVDRKSPDDRQRRASEIVQHLFNSLLDQGYVRVTSEYPLRFQVISGSLTGSGPPDVDTDKTVGAVVGCHYIDTDSQKAYICLDSTIGGAVWKEVT